MFEQTEPEPFIIMCAPNGARRTNLDHPQIPMTPTELADCAADIMEAGASIIHLHVRDEQQQHSLSVDRYKWAIDAITDKVGNGLVIQVTTEAVGRYSLHQQMAMVRELKPEAASIALRELVPIGSDLSETKAFFEWMEDQKVWPQIILYDETDFQRYQQMQQQGIFGRRRQFLLFVLKKQQQTASNLGFSITPFKQFPPKIPDPWAACCFGKQEYQLPEFCSKNGGHVRVGFENNIWREDNTLASNNAELVRHAHNTMRPKSRKIATASDVRKILMRAHSATIKQKEFR